MEMRWGKRGFFKNVLLILVYEVFSGFEGEDLVGLNVSGQWRWW